MRWWQRQGSFPDTLSPAKPGSEVKVGLAGSGGEVRRQQRHRGLAAGLGLWPTRQERTVHGETVCVLVTWFSVATFSNDSSV